MDLDNVRQKVGLDIVEWHQIKEIDPEALSIIKQGSRLAIPPGWRALSERFPCQAVRGYAEASWIVAGDNSIGADFAYQYLLALEAIPVPGTDRYEVTTLVDDIVRGNQDSKEQVICLSYTFTAQFEPGHNRWDISWSAVGQHMRFLPRFAAFVEDLIAYRFGEWERYQPLTETQVLGRDPDSLHPPSSTIKQLLERINAPLNHNDEQDDSKTGEVMDGRKEAQGGRYQITNLPIDSMHEQGSSSKDHKIIPGQGKGAPIIVGQFAEPSTKVPGRKDQDLLSKTHKGKGRTTSASMAIPAAATTTTTSSSSSNQSYKRQNLTLQGEQSEHKHPQAPRNLGISPIDHGPQSERILNKKTAPRDYIAIHLRRGDISIKCRTQAIKDCIVPVSEYRKHVDKIIADNIPPGSKEPLPNVVLVSDTDDEAEKQEIDSYGWYRLDYREDENLRDSWAVLGAFGPAFIDSAVLTGRSARWVIGSRRSTMSWLAAMRLSSWHNRTIIYPALPPELVKQQQDELEEQKKLESGKRALEDFAWNSHAWLDETEANDNLDGIVVLDRQEQTYFDHIYPLLDG
ncbi:hypothetical protein BGW41_005768 [Actinomortierella wolfii]|nr:hypothetical protein BGW41_005768 [Actinomortierella wolfii]